MMIAYILAFAPPPSQGGGDATSGLLSTFIMFVAIILIFYFFIIRPQRKRQLEHQKLIESLKKGDRVVLASGIYGTVSEIEDSTILLQIADNVRIKVDKNSVANVIEKK